MELVNNKKFHSVQDYQDNMRDRYCRFIETVDELVYDDRLTYCVPYLKNQITSFAVLDADPRYEFIMSTAYVEISRSSDLKYKWDLSRIYNGYFKFKPILFPGEIVKGATLYSKAILPTDTEKRQKFLDGTLDDYKWMWHDDQREWFDIPIKYVNAKSDGSFQFFDIPIWTMIFNPTYIEIEYLTRGKIDPNSQITVGVEGILAHVNSYTNINKIMGYTLYENNRLQLQGRISEFNICPVCGIQSENSASCENGHHWHIDPDTNLISINEGDVDF